MYRYNDGTVTGQIVGGVFRGWWTESPSRRRRIDSGRFEWRLLQTSDGPVVAGSWGPRL